MAADISSTVLGWDTILSAVDAAYQPKPRGAYKKRASQQ
jgi:hypothetical protein